jgi:hypothetical protein
MLNLLFFSLVAVGTVLAGHSTWSARDANHLTRRIDRPGDFNQTAEIVVLDDQW